MARDVELDAQVGKLAQHFSDVGDRLDVLGAAVQSLAGDADALHELENALAELAQRPLADPALEHRLDELTRMLEELAERPVGDPATEQRLDAHAAALEEIRSTTLGLAERPAGDPALDEKLFELTSRLRVSELAERPAVDPSLLQRLGELESRIEDLPGDEVLERIETSEQALDYRIAAAVARVDEVASAVEQVGDSTVSREAWDEAAALLNSRIEVERDFGERLAELEQRLTEAASNRAGSGKAAGADPKLVEQVAALSARVDQLVAGGAVLSHSYGSVEAAVDPTPATLERDVEHVLMAIERLSVHLGAHERALTELMGSSGLAAQVRELGARRRSRDLRRRLG